MNNTAKMVALLSRLRREMNGAVVEAMEQRGIRYQMNYGVSLPTLREIAAEYAFDDDLARLLYRQQVRELQLAAFVVADPDKLSEESMEFWADGIGNVELAENFASSLLCHSSIAEQTISNWLGDDRRPELIRYTALVCLAKIASSVGRSKTLRLIEPYLQSDNRLLNMAAENAEIACAICDE